MQLLQTNKLGSPQPISALCFDCLLLSRLARPALPVTCDFYKQPLFRKCRKLYSCRTLKCQSRAIDLSTNSCYEMRLRPPPETHQIHHIGDAIFRGSRIRSFDAPLFCVGRRQSIDNLASSDWSSAFNFRLCDMRKVVANLKSFRSIPFCLNLGDFFDLTRACWKVHLTPFAS